MSGWALAALTLVSVGLLAWQALPRRSRFDVQADWLVGTTEPMLRLVVHNVGRGTGTIRDVRFKERAMPLGRGWTPYETILSQLPVAVGAGEASPAFEVEPRRKPWHILDDGLLCGRIDALEVEDGLGRVTTHALPLLYEAEHNAQTNSGRLIAKSRP